MPRELSATQRMRRRLKAFLCLAGAILASPFLAFAAYDIAVFQPRMPEVRSFLAGASPEEQSPPETLIKALHGSYPQSLSAVTSRLLVRNLRVVPPGAGNLRWHATGAAWWALVAFHLTEREQTTLLLALSPMGGDTRGFAQASPAVVGVPLGAVSIDQAARLVTVSKAPARYLGDPDRLARAAEALALRAKYAM